MLANSELTEWGCCGTSFMLDVRRTPIANDTMSRRFCGRVWTDEFPEQSLTLEERWTHDDVSVGESSSFRTSRIAARILRRSSKSGQESN